MYWEQNDQVCHGSIFRFRFNQFEQVYLGIIHRILIVCEYATGIDSEGWPGDRCEINICNCYEQQFARVVIYMENRQIIAGEFDPDSALRIDAY